MGHKATWNITWLSCAVPAASLHRWKSMLLLFKGLNTVEIFTVSRGWILTICFCLVFTSSFIETFIFGVFSDRSYWLVNDHWISLNMTCSLGSHLLLSSSQNLHIDSWSNFILVCFRCRSSPAEWHQSCWDFHWLCWSGAHRISGGQTRKLHTEKNMSEPWTQICSQTSLKQAHRRCFMAQFTLLTCMWHTRHDQTNQLQELQKYNICLHPGLSDAAALTNRSLRGICFPWPHLWQRWCCKDWGWPAVPQRRVLWPDLVCVGRWRVAWQEIHTYL